MAEQNPFIEGMNAYRQGRYPDALRLLGSLLDRPDLSGRLARYYCAMSHRAVALDRISFGSYAQAAQHLCQAIALVGNRGDLAEYLLLSFAGTGQYDRCAGAAEGMVAAEPNRVTHRVRLAQAQWRSGQRPLAYMTLTEALRQLGDDVQLHLNLGLFYAAEEKFGQARGHFVQAIECDPACGRAEKCLGLAESVLGDFRQAARAFQRAWVLDPADLLIAQQMCLAADAAAKAGSAVTVQLPGPVTPTATSQIRQLAEYAAAEHGFIQAFLALPPTDADGELFGILRSVVRVGLACHEDYADLHFQAALICRRLEDVEAARGHLRRAVQINPNYAKALVELGELSMRTGATDEAVACLEQAVRAGADWADVHVRLGDLLRQIGRSSSARNHYHRALQLNEYYQPAASGLTSLAA